ncbi:unnamed protein product [Effrenium voratum]|nr:unnamed protein product [Effrenium voratum]
MDGDVELPQLSDGYEELAHPPLVPEGRSLSGSGGLWRAGARCIFFDLTYMHVWSKFLAFLCFLNATLLLGEESFYSLLSQLPSSSSCLQNHRVGFCDQSGENRFHDSTRVEVVLSPVESEKLQLESPSVWTLCLVLVVAFANSRYVTKLHQGCILPLTLLGAVLCLTHTATTVMDLSYCGSSSAQHPVDWTALHARWGNRSITPGAKRVAEYCWVPRRRLWGKGRRHREGRKMRTRMAEMERSEFALNFANQSRVTSYCSEVLQMHSMAQCLRWLNSTHSGNRIECEDGQLLASAAALPELQSQMAALTGAGSDREQLQQLLLLADRWALELLSARRCQAKVSGANFGLRPPSLGPGSPGGASAVAKHLLALARKEEASELRIVSREGREGRRGGNLPELEEEYLQEHFAGCVAKIFVRCAGRAASATLTTFRSACQATCAMLMLLGYMRMLALRLGFCRWCASRSSRFYWVQEALNLLSSRVGVGLLMATLLQVGFTVLVNEVAVTWIAEGNGLSAAESLKLYPLSLVDVLLVLAIRLQLLVFLVAVCYNSLLHVKLRRQILALPRQVLFGRRAEVPDSYRGPDLTDLKRMGSSTLVYAMYFPGIVFWHFFYASWILVLMFCFALGCVVLVSQPAELRSSHAEKVWPVLTYSSFLGSVLLAHFVTRLFTQQCLLHRHGRGIQIRCLCLFSWYEVMLFLLSFAVGPTAALWDYFKGFICTVLASLIIEKPNFTQFGELADYVYCTYCAALLLERMDADRLEDDSPRQRVEEEGFEPFQEMPWDSKVEPRLLDSSYESRSRCLRRTAFFWLLFLGLPFFAAATVDRSSFALGLGLGGRKGARNTGHGSARLCVPELLDGDPAAADMRSIA